MLDMSELDTPKKRLQNANLGKETQTWGKREYSWHNQISEEVPLLSCTLKSNRQIGATGFDGLPKGRIGHMLNSKQESMMSEKNEELLKI